KERLVKSFVSTEARILQQPHLLSSDYFQKLSKISSTTSTTCASDLSLAGGEFYRHQQRRQALIQKIGIFFLGISLYRSPLYIERENDSQRTRSDTGKHGAKPTRKRPGS
ncbi:hypothetical protein F7R03_26850, partial [Pseudomonas palleroniana]